MLTTNSDGIPVLEDNAVVKRRFVLALGFFALLGLLLFLLGNSGSSDRLIGSGSTFAQPLVQRLTQDYQTAQSGSSDWSMSNASVDYEPVGSLGGIMRLKDPEVDFALTDYSVGSQVLDEMDAFQFPIAAGSISPSYNLKATGLAPINMSADLLAAIFAGKVATWNDPLIAAENPGVALPATPLKVAFRSDDSGTTFNFTSFLSESSSMWKETLGSGTQVKWPAGEGVKGSSKMAEYLAATDGAIGYLETGQAKRAGLQVAAVRNAAGQYVLPEKEGVIAGSKGASAGGSASTESNAYPLVAVVYALVKSGEKQRADSEEALRFFGFLFEKGASRIEELGYLPMPQTTINEIRKQWESRFGKQSAS